MVVPSRDSQAPSSLGHQKEPAATSEYEHGHKQSLLCLFFSLLPFFCQWDIVPLLLLAAGTLVLLSSGWLSGAQPVEMPLGAWPSQQSSVGHLEALGPYGRSPPCILGKEINGNECCWAKDMQYLLFSLTVEDPLSV